MAALVEDRVHRGCHIVLVVVGGDADILIVEFQRKGMLRLTQTTMAAVEAHHLHQIVGEGLLLCCRVLLMQEAVVDLRLLADFVDERHQPLPQRRKEAVQHLHIHAAFILVQQSVIGRFRGIIITGKAAIVVYKLLQNGAEQCKIVLCLGLVPDVVRPVAQLFVGHIFVSRDAGQLLTAAAQLLHFAAVDEVQLPGPGAQLIQQRFRLGAGHQFLAFSRQNAHGHAPALGGIAGRGGHGVQIKGAVRTVVGVQLLLQQFQLLQGAFYLHCRSPFSLIFIPNRTASASAPERGRVSQTRTARWR